MTWFKVDDGLHSHPKTRKVLAKAPSALALWVVAGSWSSDNLTDGLIPDHQLPWLIPQGAEEMARELVAARFWKRVRGGYLFHEWSEDGDGTRRNPTRAEVESDRLKKAEAGRKGGLARAQKAPTGKVGKGRRGTNEGPTSDQRKINEGTSSDLRATTQGSTDSTTEAPSTSADASSKSQAPAKAPASGLLHPPTRPDPYIGGALGDPLTPRVRDAPPPSKCPDHEHLDDPPPCGRCADARRAREAWDHAQAAAAAEARSRAAREHAEAVRLAIAACDQCAPDGRLPGGLLCSHDPANPDRTRRGAAAVRAAIRKEAT